MEDLPGIGKVLDSKVAQRLYEDAIAPPAKQVGALSGDLLKTFRLFTAPLQYLASYQDRLDAWLEEVRQRVPPERQLEAPANIAGPVLMNLRFEDEHGPLKAMYLNLLTAAIDKDWKNAAHPAYVRIIEQLSPEEAVLLAKLYELDRELVVESGPDATWANLSLAEALGAECEIEADATQIITMLSHLQGLSLTTQHLLTKQQLAEAGYEHIFAAGFALELTLSKFGHQFCRVCIPIR